MNFKLIMACGCALLLATVQVQEANSQGFTWEVASGYFDLEQELGTTLPDGSGIVVSQVEAPLSSGAYISNPQDSHFSNPTKIFTNLSGLSTAVSGHANTVGRFFYGNSRSQAPQITEVFQYEANDWLNNGLGFATGGNPAPHDYDVQNHSWIGNGVPDNIAINLLRRADFLVNEHNMNMVVGASNSMGGATPQLMGHGFNSITVGTTIGEHSTQSTTFLDPGRQKPEIVAFQNVSSFASASVASLACLLRDAAGGTNAEQNEVIKAMLLAGATKKEFADWSQTDTLPLDNAFGVGEANIYNSYKIFAAGETNGAPVVAIDVAASEGWDYETIEAGGSRQYMINLTEPVDHLSVALTWNIEITDLNTNVNVFFPGATLPNMELEMTGTGFSRSSRSPGNNIEHIYATNLQPGTYIFNVSSDLATDYALAWRAAETSSSAVSGITLVTGSETGDLVSIQADDENFYALSPGFQETISPDTGLQESAEYVASAEFETATSIFMPNAIQFSMDGFVNSSNLELQVEFYNFASDQFVAMPAVTAATTESNVTVEIFDELNHYVENGTGSIRARATWRAIGPVSHFPWSATIDNAEFIIAQ